MKRIKLTFKILLFSFVIAGFPIKKVQAENSKNSKQINLLFFQNAQSGEIIPDETNKNCYQLVLNDTDHKIIYFADEPARLTGTLSLPQFLITWQHNYLQYRLEPNVVISAVTTDNNQKITDIAFFSDPIYDLKNKKLSYMACSIRHKKEFSKLQLKDVNLFFDPFHRWPP